MGATPRWLQTGGRWMMDPLDVFGTGTAIDAAREQERAQEEAFANQQQEIADARQRTDLLYDQGGSEIAGYGQMGADALTGYGSQAQGLYGGAQSALGAGYGQAAQQLGQYQAGGTLAGLMSRGDALATMDGQALLAQDPGYQARLQAGQDAIQQAASATGGRMSGRTLQALSDNASNTAAQEYGQAFARQQSLLGQQYGAASSVDAMQQAQNNLGAQMAYGYGQGAASLYGQQAGAAQSTGAQLAGLYGQTGAGLAQMNAGQAQQQAGLTGTMIDLYGQNAGNAGMALQAEANGKQNTANQAAGIVGSIFGARMGGGSTSAPKQGA